MELFLGIDIGSTSIKSNIYDLKGKLISGGTRPTVLSHPYKGHPSWLVWEPDIIWKAIKDSIMEALGGIDSKNDVKAVAVTGFGMDGVPVDKNGKWLYPFISWHCPRTEEQCSRWSSQVGPYNIFSTSGNQVMHINTVYRILWIMENQPEIIEKTYKWLLIEDYVNYLLCGEMATDYSMASCTSIFEQKSLTWSDELLKKAGIDAAILPDPKPSGTILGNITAEASRETGLPETTKVVLGGHDYHCAALAIGAFVPEVVMSVNGTWEMVFQSTDIPMLEEKVFKNGISVESHIAKGKYDIVAYSVSCLMYEWLNNTICSQEQAEAKCKNISVWEVLEKKASSAPLGSNGIFFTPYFTGAGSPHMDTKAFGAFLGLTQESDRGSIIRSVIEALNYQFYEMIMAFEEAAGSSIEKVVATGGATKNRFWTQNKADITGKTMEVPGVEEATSLGAAMISAIGTGFYKSEKEAYEQTYRVDYTCIPDKKKSSQYEHYYNSIFKRLFRDLKDINHIIFDEFRK